MIYCLKVVKNCSLINKGCIGLLTDLHIKGWVGLLTNRYKGCIGLLTDLSKGCVGLLNNLFKGYVGLNLNV